MEASEFRFSPSTLRVAEGEIVRFSVKNTGEIPHEFELKALGVEVIIPQGKSVALTVRPLKAGVYNLVCDLPGHLKAGMEGELIVKPR